MSFARKLKRQNKHLTRCCGQQMVIKVLRTPLGAKMFYVCEKCGKAKAVEK